MRRWSVLLGCFIGMGVAIPIVLMLPFGLYMKSVTMEFGWSRTQFSAIISIASVFNAVALPVAGYLVDRFGARRLVAIGTALGCGSYMALSLVHSYVGFIALAVLAVTTGNLASYPAYMGVAQRWFDKRLGLALAITSTGVAVGVGAVSYVITNTIELSGWRDAFLVVGIGTLVIGLANLLFLLRDNTGPMPEAERRDAIVQLDVRSDSLAGALRTREFWLYALSFSLVIFALVGCNFHLPALLSDRGAAPTLIASIVAIGSAGSLFGRLFTGLLLDRFPARNVLGVFLLGQAIGFLLLLNGLRWALPAGFLLGAVQGAEIDVMGYVVARRFGRGAYSRIFGTCFAITLTGAMAGPLVMAAIFDRTASYDLGLVLFSLLPVLAFGLFFLASRSERKNEVPVSASAVTTL